MTGTDEREELLEAPGVKDGMFKVPRTVPNQKAYAIFLRFHAAYGGIK